MNLSGYKARYRVRVGSRTLAVSSATPGASWFSFGYTRNEEFNDIVARRSALAARRSTVGLRVGRVNVSRELPPSPLFSPTYTTTPYPAELRNLLSSHFPLYAFLFPLPFHANDVKNEEVV